MARVFVIITTCAGCINEVIGIGDRQNADLLFDEKQAELGIVDGQESEHTIQLHELDVEFYPPSVRARRETW
jgi:hypothetical protein